jgi:hypothetical protein
LNNHTYPLAQFQIGKRVTSVRPSAITQIFEKCSGILPKNTCGLERHWDKVMGHAQLTVQAALCRCSLISNSTSPE